MKKNTSAVVIGIVVLSIVLPTVSSIIVQNQNENQKDAPDGAKEKDKPVDKTPPIISIENLPGGDCTDENPGQWEISAYDDESGIDEDSIEISVDGDLIGDCFSYYDVPSTLGDHIIEVEVMNDNDKNPLLGLSSNTVSIIDDDQAPPDLSDFTIECNGVCVVILLTALDYSGIMEFEILINEEVVIPINIEENDNNFIFILENQWIFESGIIDVEVLVKDADDDRENDALISSIYGTFEISIEDGYEFISYKIEELQTYIDSNIGTCIKDSLIQTMTFIKNILCKALSCFEEGRVVYSLFYDVVAVIIILVVEVKIERIDKLSDEHVNHMLNKLHIIRNCIFYLMGEKEYLL